MFIGKLSVEILPLLYILISRISIGEPIVKSLSPYDVAVRLFSCYSEIRDSAMYLFYLSREIARS